MKLKSKKTTVNEREIDDGGGLLADGLLQRGELTLLLGCPGVGKMHAALWLAGIGARGYGDWFGHPVRSSFRTLVVQRDMGSTRLARALRALNLPEASMDSIRVSTVPDTIMRFDVPMVYKTFKAEVKRFQPDLVIINPSNIFEEGGSGLVQIARVRKALKAADVPPALLFVHHLRKPRVNARHRRGKIFSQTVFYTMSSTAREACVLNYASDAVEDSRVVFSVVKSDGPFYPGPPRTAWRPQPEGFEAVADFDWESFDREEAR
jgi:RecA-family ATPase